MVLAERMAGQSGLELIRLMVADEVAPPPIAELRRRGHDVEVTAAWSLGRVSAVARERDGLLKAGANPRGMQGYAVGR